MGGRLVGIAVVLALVGPGPASAAQPCTLPGAHVVAESGRARLLSVRGHGDYPRLIYGCLRGQHPRLLARDLNARGYEDYETQSGFRLAGATVAWIDEAFGSGEPGDHTRDIRAVSLARSRPAVRIGTYDDALGDENYGRILGLAAGTDGSVAWVIQTPDGSYEIDGVSPHAVRLTAIAVVAARPRALAVGAGSVRWHEGNRRRSARLPAPVALPRGDVAGTQGLDGRFGTCGSLSVAGAGANSAALALARAPGGAVVAAGTAGRTQLVAVRILPDGSPDPSFGTAGVAAVTIPQSKNLTGIAIAGAVVQPDGGVVIAGDLRASSGPATPLVARLRPDGTPDPGFASSGIAKALPAGFFIEDLALASDGAVLVAGATGGHLAVARLLGDGSADKSFGSDGVAIAGPAGGAAHALAVAADGTVAAAGEQGGRPALARFTPAGAALGFAVADPPAQAAFSQLVVLPDGRLVAAGTASNLAASGQMILARFSRDGVLDDSFARSGFALDPELGAARSLGLAADGALVAATTFGDGDIRDEGVARFSAADGRRDPGFGWRGALGARGVDLFLYDAMPGDDGTIWLAQQRNGGFAVSRYAAGDPALAATAGEPMVCRFHVVAERELMLEDGAVRVGLQLRRPGRLVLSGSIAIAGRTFRLIPRRLLVTTVGGTAADVRLPRAALRWLRAHRHPAIRPTIHAR